MSKGTPLRDEATEALIKRFRAQRTRRRRLVLVATIVVILVVVGGSATALALTLSDHSTPAGTGSAAALAESGLEKVGSGGPTTSTQPGDSTSSGPTSGASEQTTNSQATTTNVHTSSTVHATTVVHASTTTSSSAVHPSTTVHESTTTTAGSSAAAADKVVVIDPGHQATGDNSPEPVGPGSSTTKPKVASGTAGVVTGTPESKLALAVGLKLRDALVAHGIKVVMTRTTQDVNISNSQRAQIANKAHADLFVRVHADGATTASTHGIHVLYPATIKGWTDDIAVPSKKAAQLAQQYLIAATGAQDRGIDARSDMSGFNWADVPAIIPEIGFMTNPAEDKLLETAAYQDKVVQGLTKAILAFLGLK